MSSVTPTRYWQASCLDPLSLNIPVLTAKNCDLQQCWEGVERFLLVEMVRKRAPTSGNGQERFGGFRESFSSIAR